MTLVDRTDEIARAIANTCLPIVGAKMHQDDCQEAFQSAVAGRLNTRESIFIALADLSLSGGWLPNEIDRAAKEAVRISSNGNKLDKSMTTMVSESKVAMHPTVRAFVPSLVQMRDNIWAVEGVLTKEDPQPYRKTFSRAQHMLTRMFVAVRDGVKLDTMEACDVWVASLSPDLDPKKMHAKALAALNTLIDVQRAIPTGLVQRAINELNGICAEDFEAALKALTSMGDAEPATPADEPETDEPEDNEHSIVDVVSNPDLMMMA